MGVEDGWSFVKSNVACRARLLLLAGGLLGLRHDELRRRDRHIVALVGDVAMQRIADVRPVETDHRGSQQCRVSGGTHANRCDGHAGRHLDDGEQCIHPIETRLRRIADDGNPDDRDARRVGLHHAGQMCGTAGTSDDDAVADVGPVCEELHAAWGPMRRRDERLIGDAEFDEDADAVPHATCDALTPVADGAHRDEDVDLLQFLRPLDEVRPRFRLIWHKVSHGLLPFRPNGLISMVVRAGQMPYRKSLYSIASRAQQQTTRHSAGGLF